LHKTTVVNPFFIIFDIRIISPTTPWSDTTEYAIKRGGYRENLFIVMLTTIGSLQGMSTKLFPKAPSQVRRCTERDLKNSEFRDTLCCNRKGSTGHGLFQLELQDQMNADIFLDINSMHEEIGILKDQVFGLKRLKNGPETGAKK
jgi:hypothetical protein